jgi:hypothetical protein
MPEVAPEPMLDDAPPKSTRRIFNPRFSAKPIGGGLLK